MRKTQIALLAAGVAALVVGGTALASKGKGGERLPVGPTALHGGLGPGAGLDAAASYLGVPASDLVTALRSGKTLADVASSTSGKSPSGLIAALVAAEKSHLAAAVKDGRLTQAQADTIGAGL